MPYNVQMTKQKNKSLLNVQSKGRDMDGIAAKANLAPIIQSASVINQYNSNLDINALTVELVSQYTKLRDENNLDRVEEMLLSQAHTLDMLFCIFAKSAQKAEYMSNLQGYLNLALKSQNQCRMTLQAIVDMKQPKAFVQNNNAQYQQVNNNLSSPQNSEKESKSSNELLEHIVYEQEWVDTPAPQETSGNDKKLATVEVQHRCEN